jgi:hypothetical protein
MHYFRTYCDLHFKEITGAVCNYCWLPASGNGNTYYNIGIVALDSTWCENHFVIAEFNSSNVWDVSRICLIVKWNILIGTSM